MTEHLKEIIENAGEVRGKLIKMNGEIGQLDEEVDKLMNSVKAKTLLYCKNQKRIGRDAKMKASKEIQGLYNDIVEKSQKKAQIAKEMYDFIDENIRDLDKKTSTFNIKMCKKTAEEQKKIMADGPSTSGARDKKKKKDDKKADIDLITDFKPLQLEAMDMPVNPSEPRYCICHQVSFGEMIGCDSPTCKYEWFHYQCLGITKAPPGEFICDYCKAEKDKRLKKKK